MAFTEFAEYVGLGLAELVRRGEVSPAELVEAAIERIERHNPVLNAVVHKAYDEARRVARGAPNTAELIQRYWDWCSAAENLPVMRLVIEASALEATRSGLPASLREGLITDWVASLTAGLRRDGLAGDAARTAATLTNAAIIGLALDLLATGDRRRTNRAVRDLIERLRAQIA